MDGNYKPRRNKNIVEKGAEPEVVLYNPDTSVVHIINNTAFHIWKFSDGRHSVDNIENKLKKIFNLPEGSSLFTDIENTLNIFKVNGLIL